MTEVAHLPGLSSGAQRMRRYRERRRRGSCHFDRLRVSHQQHTMSRIVGVANKISAVFCIRINHLLTLRTTRPTWSAR
jgi:hypothetical protein